MRKRILLLVLCLALVIGNFAGFSLATTATSSSTNEDVSYLEGSDLLYDLMETATTFVVAQHKALGGSHYAYTEGLYEESTGNSPEGTESNFAAGSRLVLITLEAEGTKVKKTEKVILTSRTGCLRDPDVSADGTKLLFSWKQKNSDDFHIYEMELTSGKYEYKQITFGSGVADIECKYLPNGDILFSSTRCVQTVDCWKTPVSNLYKCSADGSNIVRLGYDQVHTTFPTLTSDGRVIYTRWDYNDRTQMYIQGLFQMNPDGTNQTELYGNNSNFPTTLVHAREVPGASDLYIAIATGHHTYQGGKLCFIDVSEGRDGKNSVTFPLENIQKNDNIDTFGQSGAIYQYPYAISSEAFLVSVSKSGWASNRQKTDFDIYLMNAKKASSREEILICDGTSEFPAAQIVPVKTREMFVRPSMVDYSKTTGTYYIGNVYEGESVKGVEKGSVKHIRVVALDYRAYAVGATVASGSGSSDPYTPIATGNGSWDIKQVLGLATVYEDGSAMFSVPSETPVYFQLLDKDGNMIQTMRSWSTLMPNEIYSCVGCHEDNNTTPPASATTTLAMKAGIETLQPDVWQTEEDYDPYTTFEGFSYVDEIQTIWDKNCISCHNNKSTAYSEINVGAMNNSGASATTSGTEEKIFGLQENWKYYISSSNNAGSGWNTASFNDSSWSTGKAGFGDRGSDGANVGTSWSGGNNWLFLRKTFTISNVSKYDGASMLFNTWFDDTVKIYINGNLVYSNDGWVDSYSDINVGATASKYLVNGTNVIAVSVNQHTGGRFFDTGLSMIIPDPNDPSAKNPFSLEGELLNADRMKRYFPLSYLVLTASTPNGGRQWVGKADNKYINWISTMSVPELLEPNTYGASASPLMTLLRSGHKGVKLTDAELRTIAAWIDLAVPCYGEYDDNAKWSASDKKEAEEEQNKRDYYDMLNDYARMSLSGTLPEGLIKATYTSGAKKYTGEAEGILRLYIPQRYKAKDKIVVTLPEGVKYIGFTLTAKMGESIIYCPDGTFTYVVPATSSLVSSISSSYANTTDYVTVRILTDEELSEKRNLAENTYDYTNNSSQKSDITNQYPHATAMTEWENSKGDLSFLVRNAIDGFTNNVGHGSYPVQSWGPSTAARQWMKVEFGREVNVEELGVYIRYDVGHDTYFKTGVVEFEYADGTKSTQNITLKWTGEEQIIKLEPKKAVVSITLKNLVSEKTGWAGISELKVYGTEATAK